MTGMPISYVFFGAPEFALPILDALERAGRIPTAVVSQPDRPQGRGLECKPTPVKFWAQARGVPVFQPEKLKDPDFIEQMRMVKPDIALVAAFGQLVPKSLLD